MALVSSQVIGGDVGDSIVNSGAAVYGTANQSIGTVVQGTSPPVYTPRGYLGRFELEVPSGAVIEGVRVRFWSFAAATTVIPIPLEAGLLAADGTWPSSGFDASSYPLRSDLPWPKRFNGSALYGEPANYQGGAPAFAGSYAGATAPAQEWSFGDGLEAKHAVGGLVAQAQTWLESATADVRASTASGTALPIAFAIVPTSLTSTAQAVRTVDYLVDPAQRPTLEIEFLPPTPSSIRGTGRAAEGVQASSRHGAAVTGSALGRESTEARTVYRPAVSASARMIEAVRGTGRVR